MLSIEFDDWHSINDIEICEVIEFISPIEPLLGYGAVRLLRAHFLDVDRGSPLDGCYCLRRSSSKYIQGDVYEHRFVNVRV